MSGPARQTRSTRRRIAKLIGFMAILAFGASVFGVYIKYEADTRRAHAIEALSAGVGERAARLQEWLLRVDRTLSWFRAEDVQASDRLAVTVRMLHTERFVGPATSLFLFSTSGRLIAGTLPLPEGATGVSTQHWFKSVQGSPIQLGLRLTGCTRDPFGKNEGVVLYRAVLDHDTLVGFVGTFLSQAAIAGAVRDDDPTDGTIYASLRSADGAAFGCVPPVAPPAVPVSFGWGRTLLSHVIHGRPELNERSRIAEDRLVTPGDLHLIASADVMDTMSDADWQTLAYRAGYVALSLLLIMALMTSMLFRWGRPERRGLLAKQAGPPADGADWMWELDDAGNLVGLAGNAPDHLLPPSGRPLVDIAGTLASRDMRWDKLTAAICAKHAFEGLQVPFQLPGREGLLTIFEFTGQPVVASGGFWGTASLVSEESVSTPAPAPMPKVTLSVAQA
ncbi:hypothetical protein [Acidisphaera sp. L21]|uniref:hypothetical protein n=1 Tax=Acidisphaera sp. L21 TaxID=1641851 RepID=UPI00131C5375|nr:hypothetical protein [Acidisphaera sp. L21]